MMGLSVSMQVLAERVLNSIPEGLLIAALAWLVLQLVGRQNSGTRFAVWLVALFAIALVPFVPLMHVGGSVSRAVHAEVTLPGSWVVWILGAWGVIAFFGIARLLFGLLRLRALRRNSIVKPLEELEPVLRRTIEECQAVRPMELRVSSEVRVPTAIGFFKPAVLIPEWSWQELSAEELRAVVLHEFAHLRRRDDWTNLAQKVLRAIFFFHPAVLWVENRLSLEREMACDDAVLAETQDPQAYARCLVSLAEKSFVRRSVALAQAAVSRARDTSRRIAEILDVKRPKATRVFKPVLAAVGGVVALSFLVLPSAPQLIAFGDRSESASAEMSSQVPKSMIVPAVARLDKTGATLRETKGGSTSDAQQYAHPTPTMTRVEGGEVPQSDSLAMTPAKHREVPARPAVIMAGARTSVAARKPRMLQASLKQEQAMQQFLVFTESTDYYRQGSAVVGVSVLRVMLVSAPVDMSQQPKSPART